MKLRHKKTGEIANWCIDKDVIRTCDSSIVYASLAELNEEWEDYEEPKGYWCIDWDGGINHIDLLGSPEGEHEEKKKQIGNYFETKEEAEKAVEKLKAWKRLKDKGFKFNDYLYIELSEYAKVSITATVINDCISDDLMLLFGGEE